MRALVLSGGASKGAYQVGVLRKWIKEEKRDYQILVGTSVGAINSVQLAQAPPGELEEYFNQLYQMWLDLDTKQVYVPWSFWGKIAALWKPSVYNSYPLTELLSDRIDKEKLAASERELRVVAVSWKTGKVVVVNGKNSYIDSWVAASASFPVFLSPIEIEGELYTDGGVREIAPLGGAIRLGATEIDVIITSRPEVPDDWDSEGKSVLQFALRTVDIMSTELLLNDIRVCGLKNDLAVLGSLYKKVKINVHTPSGPITDNSLDFSPDKIRKMLEHGYKDALGAD